MTVDLIVSNGDRIYADALSHLSTSHKELANTIAEATTEDNRIVNLLHTSEKKTVKLPAETRITDERTGEEIQIGKRVVVGKERVDILEAEVASLWEQWEAAQKEVDDVKAELMSSLGSDKGGGMRSVDGMQGSLAAEMAKFEAELTAILEDVHEDARASEKVSWSFVRLMGWLADLVSLYRASARRSKASCLPFFNSTCWMTECGSQSLSIRCKGCEQRATEEASANSSKRSATHIFPRHLLLKTF